MREYCLYLNPEQGQTCVQVNVKETGEINLRFSLSDDENNNEFCLTFKSDADVRGLVELLRWSRVSSLKAQGYKVVM